MDLLADIAQHAAFRTEDVERRRKQRLVQHIAGDRQRRSMALRVGPKLIFGDQPYGLTSGGTTESVTALTSADIVRLLQEPLWPKGLSAGAGRRRDPH